MIALDVCCLILVQDFSAFHTTIHASMPTFLGVVSLELFLFSYAALPIFPQWIPNNRKVSIDQDSWKLNQSKFLETVV